MAVMPVTARCMKAKDTENQAVDRNDCCLVKSLSRRGHGGIPARLAEMRGGNAGLREVYEGKRCRKSSC